MAYSNKKALVILLSVMLLLSLHACNNVDKHYNESLTSSVPDDSRMTNEKLLNGCSIVMDIPYCCSQSACYVEDGLYIVIYSFSSNDYCALRLFDSKTNQFLWEKYVNGGGHANSICFRSKDRRLYIADCVVDENFELSNTISVIEYDNIEKGIVKTITSPARGGIYSVAYDSFEDVFYSTNYTGTNEGEANVLFSYTGIFEDVKDEIALDDYSVRSDIGYSSQGVQCVVNGVAWIPYYEPQELIVGFSVVSGKVQSQYMLPDTIGDYSIIEIQGMVYNSDDETYMLIDADGMISISIDNEAKIEKNQFVYAKLDLIIELPYRWGVASCFVDDGSYLVVYVSSDGLNLVIRCFDKVDKTICWTRHIDGNYYANSICYRPADRRLYIANSWTYANSVDESDNNIMVFDYDDLDRGCIGVVSTNEQIYSIAYCTETDTFFSSNYCSDDESLELCSYKGIFEEVIKIDKIEFNTLGVCCVKDKTCYFIAYLSDYIYGKYYVIQYNYEKSKVDSLYSVPSNTIEKEKIGYPETLIFDNDENAFALQTVTNLILIVEDL